MYMGEVQYKKRFSEKNEMKMEGRGTNPHPSIKSSQPTTSTNITMFSLRELQLP